MIPLLEVIDPYQTRAYLGSYICRWERYWALRLAPLGRCEEPDFCPACRRREACPLDVWPDVVGRLSLGDPGSSVKDFLRTSGRVAGTGTYSNWKKAGVDERVLGGALLACAHYLRTTGNFVEAARVARLAREKGCRHPGIAEALAGLIAALGRLADFEAATAICDEALAHRAGSSSDGWLVLLSRRNQLAGRAQRLKLRSSGQYDEDGNPIPLRRHHPETPRRTRTPRFIRQ